MNITRENLSDLHAIIKVAVSPKDYKPTVNKTLKEQSKKINVPGFRPGKIPRQIVKKMIGAEYLAQDVHRVAVDHLNSYFEEEDLRFMGEPILTNPEVLADFDLSLSNDYEFTYEVGITPSFELQMGAVTTPKRYFVEVDDKYLEKDIKRLRDAHGETTSPEESAAGDVIYCRMNELDAEGNVIEGEEAMNEMIVLNEERIGNDGFMQLFHGKKVDDTLDVDVFMLADTAAEVEQKLLIKDDGLLEGKKGELLRFTVRRIARTAFAEMNEVFFEKVFPGEGVSSEEELRDRLANKIRDEFDQYVVDPIFRTDVRDAVLDAHPVDLPKEFLKKWLLSRAKEDKEKLDIEKNFQMYQNAFRWNLITTRIMEDNTDLEVKDEDIIAGVREMIKANMPGMDMDDELMEQYVQYSLQNEEMVNNIYGKVRDDKVFNFLREELSPVEEIISASDLEQENRDRQEKRKAETEAEAAKEEIVHEEVEAVVEEETAE